MVEKNDLFEELMIAIVDTDLNLTEFNSEQPMQEDLDIFHASFELHFHVLHVGDLEEQCLFLEHHNHLEAILVKKPSRKSVNFLTLLAPAENGADMAILLESIRAISERYVVFFEFSSKDGMDAMLENGHWFIHNNLFILKRISLNLNLLKEDVSNVPVWVMFHGIPMTAFSEDGLSGMSSYARAMIELRANVELKDTIMVAMPKLIGDGLYMCTIRVEYKWKPLRCLSCKVFGHVLDECPKKIDSDVVKNLKNPRQAARGVQPLNNADSMVDANNDNEMK
nr:hypothetical protein [Tanacetum cinerariifolium]